MNNNKYGEVAVRFTREQRERDIYVIGGRVVGDGGIFMIHGENGACLMIPKEVVVFVVCGKPGSVEVELDDSDPNDMKAIYDFRAKEDDSNEGEL